MINHPYGSPEFYSELFGDILADVDPKTTPDSADNILKGFYLAIDSWLDYHVDQSLAFSTLKANVKRALGD